MVLNDQKCFLPVWSASNFQLSFLFRQSLFRDESDEVLGLKMQKLFTVSLLAIFSCKFYFFLMHPSCQITHHIWKFEIYNSPLCDASHPSYSSHRNKSKMSTIYSICYPNILPYSQHFN